MYARHNFFEIRHIDVEVVRSKRIAVIRSYFNDEITCAMLEHTTKILDEYGLDYDVYEVRGGFQVIYALNHLLREEQYDGYVVIDCLIKGATMQYESISNNLATGIKDLIIQYNKPIGYGVLSCSAPEQARIRVGLGAQATIAVLESLTALNVPLQPNAAAEPASPDIWPEDQILS